ncbi:MAG TPA: hypothetical protein VFT03_05900 [Rubrobacteraceae bacterium]|nr:hypothetical protein [Rubrobacteraceae bacterium]
MRRLRPVARSSPVLALLAPAGLIAGLAWAGWRGAASMAASNDGASTAVVLTVGIVFAIVGFNVQHVSSAGRSLDAQVRSAPLSRLGLFMGTVGIPFAICCLVVSILSLALFVPLIYAAEAPLYAPIDLALFQAAVFYAAGALGEVLKRVTRRQPAALLAGPPLVLAWVASGHATGGGAWPGIARPLGHTVLNTTTEPALRLTGALLLLLLAGVGVWISVAAFLGLPEQQTFSHVGRQLRAPGSGSGVVSSVALKRMVRDRSVQRHTLFVALVAGTLSCLTSALLPDVAQAAVGGLLVLAALSVAIVPLATYGANRDSSWFWRSTPVSFAAYVLGMVGAGICAGTVVVVAPTAAALPFFWVGREPPELAVVVVVVVVILLVATGAGFLVPCSLENTSEQILSYAAFGASLAGVFAAGSWVAPRLTVLAIPESLVVVGLTLVVAGLVVAAAFLRERERRKV